MAQDERYLEWMQELQNLREIVAYSKQGMEEVLAEARNSLKYQLHYNNEGVAARMMDELEDRIKSEALRDYDLTGVKHRPGVEVKIMSDYVFTSPKAEDEAREYALKNGFVEVAWRKLVAIARKLDGTGIALPFYKRVETPTAQIASDLSKFKQTTEVGNDEG